MDGSIKFEWKFETDNMTLYVPKGSTVTKLKSDISSYLQIAVSRVRLYQDDKGMYAFALSLCLILDRVVELTDAKRKVDTLDATRPIHVHGTLLIALIPSPLAPNMPARGDDL